MSLFFKRAWDCIPVSPRLNLFLAPWYLLVFNITVTNCDNHKRSLCYTCFALYLLHFSLAADCAFPTVLTAQRLQRWAITLMAYQFEIQYKPTSKHGNADGLSRIQFGFDPSFDRIEQQENAEISHTVQKAFDGLPLTSQQIRAKTLRDPALKTTTAYVEQTGWPKKSPTDELAPYWNHRDSSWMEKGILPLQRDGYCRVLIPSVCSLVFYSYFTKRTKKSPEWRRCHDDTYGGLASTRISKLLPNYVRPAAKRQKHLTRNTRPGRKQRYLGNAFI